MCPRSIARRLGWSFAVHCTDEPPLRLLLSLHGLVGGSKSRVFAQGAALLGAAQLLSRRGKLTPARVELCVLVSQRLSHLHLLSPCSHW